MQLRRVFATLSLGATLSVTPTHAQAVDPCTVYTCMAGISGNGAGGGPGCVLATNVFFAIAVFDPYYDAAATAQLRRQFLTACPGASVATNVAVLNAIIARWWWLP